jgi:putative membrane protein
MIMNRLTKAPILILACAMANAGGAATTDLSVRDKDFLDSAAVAGIKEVELSRVAQTRATDARIRAFAEQMVSDHGKANDTLTLLARDNNWNMPMQMDDNGQSELGKMQERKGGELDTAYVKDMVEDHDKAVKLFRNAAQGVDNPILRDFAKATLPTIEHHQAMAKGLK